MTLTYEQVRALFPGSYPDLIKDNPGDFFTHADVDGGFFDIWYNKEDGNFHAELTKESK